MRNTEDLDDDRGAEGGGAVAGRGGSGGSREERAADGRPATAPPTAATDRQELSCQRQEGWGRGPAQEGGDDADGSEESRVRDVEPAHGVVVQHEAPDPPVLRQHARLRLYLLGGEHAAHGREQRDRKG